MVTAMSSLPHGIYGNSVEAAGFLCSVKSFLGSGTGLYGECVRCESLFLLEQKVGIVALHRILPTRHIHLGTDYVLFKGEQDLLLGLLHGISFR